MLLVDESETWKQVVPELFAVRICVDHEVAGTDKPFNQADGFKHVRGIVKCSRGPLKGRRDLFEGSVASGFFKPCGGGEVGDGAEDGGEAALEAA